MTTSTRADGTAGDTADGMAGGMGNGSVPGAEPSDDAFESEVRRFLDSHATRRTAESFVWGEGSDTVGLFAERTPAEEQADLEAARAWAQSAFDAGFGWITGPPAYGGRGLPRRLPAHLRRRSGRLPDALDVGLRHRSRHGGADHPRPRHRGGEAGVLAAHAPRRHRGLPALQRARSPGSDLASLQTTGGARRRRVGRSTARRCGRRVRSFPTSARSSAAPIRRLPKHRGLTAFVVDMHAPGVEVRPLRQMTGGASFNEVFFTDVRVPDSHRLGDVNGGWTVALTTLMNERAAIGGGGGGATAHRHHPAHRAVPSHGSRRRPARPPEAGRCDHQDPGGPLHQRCGRWRRSPSGQLPGPRCPWPRCRSPTPWCAPTSSCPSCSEPRSVADTGQWGTYRLVRLPARCAGDAGGRRHRTRSCATSSGNGCSGCPRSRGPRSLPPPSHRLLPEGHPVDE